MVFGPFAACFFLTLTGCFHPIDFRNSFISSSYFGNMGQHINDFSVFVFFFLDIALLTLSIFFCNKDFSPKYLRIFPILPLISIIDGVCWILSFSSQKEHAIIFIMVRIIHIAILPFDLIFFSYLLLFSLQSSLAKKISVRLNLLFFIFYGVFLFSFILNKNQVLTIISNASCDLLKSSILIILCLFYFRGIFKKTHLPDLTKEPSFWLALGILFKFSLQIPILLFENYFMKQNMPKTVITVFFFENFSIAISYLLFIKAMTCRIIQ